MTTIGSRSGLRFCSFIVILLCTLSCTCSSWDTAPLYRQNGDGSELFEGDGFDGLHSSFTNREWDTDTSQRDISVKCDKCITIATLITSALENNATLEAIDKALNALCVKNFGTDPSRLSKCEIIAKELLLEVQSLDEQLLEKFSPRVLCQIFDQCTVDCCLTETQPEQIHIAIGDYNNTADTYNMAVEWTTQDSTPTSTCQWSGSPDIFAQSSTGSSTTYTNGGWIGVLHRCTIPNLPCSKRFYYRVGDSASGWSSANLSFITPPTPSINNNARFAVYGDMGAGNRSDATIAVLEAYLTQSRLDAILHLGDISYADGDESKWDQFLRKVQPIAGNIPYMTAVGNHEAWFHFESYKHRFSMPGNNTFNKTGGANPPMYYSFDYGNVRVISYSCEELFGVAPDLYAGRAQHKWLEQELSRANSPYQRSVTPWLIVMAHRPLYCSNKSKKCQIVGYDYYRHLLEPLFVKYNVDLVLNAHLHDYERSYPVYNGTVTSTSYDNPTAPVYMVVGTGGNEEGLEHSFLSPSPSWSAYHNSTNGFGYLTTHGAQSLTFQFVLADSGDILDSFTITRS